MSSSNTFMNSSAFQENVLDMDDVVYYVDARDEEASNWLRYINCARHSLEESVDSVQCYGRRFYITIRDVHPGQELLVYYGKNYAERLGIEANEFSNNDFWLHGRRSNETTESTESTESADSTESKKEILISKKLTP